MNYNNNNITFLALKRSQNMISSLGPVGQTNVSAKSARKSLVVGVVYPSLEIAKSELTQCFISTPLGVQITCKIRVGDFYFYFESKTMREITLTIASDFIEKNFVLPVKIRYVSDIHEISPSSASVALRTEINDVNHRIKTSLGKYLGPDSNDKILSLVSHLVHHIGQDEVTKELLADNTAKLIQEFERMKTGPTRSASEFEAQGGFVDSVNVPIAQMSWITDMLVGTSIEEATDGLVEKLSSVLKEGIDSAEEVVWKSALLLVSTGLLLIGVARSDNKLIMIGVATTTVILTMVAPGKYVESVHGWLLSMASGQFLAQSGDLISGIATVAFFGIQYLAFKEEKFEFSFKHFQSLVSNFPRASNGFAEVFEWLRDLFKAIVNFLEEKLLGSTGRFTIRDTNYELEKLVAEVEEFNRLYVNGDLPLNHASGTKLITLQMELRKLLLLCTRPKDSGARSVISSCLRVLDTIESPFKAACLTGSNIRMPPLAIFVNGGTGSGKTFMTVPFVEEIVLHTIDESQKKNVIDNMGDFIYTREQEHEYWDGYRNQFCTVFDDFGQAKDTATSTDNEYMDMIRCCGSFQHSLHMSNLSEKGKTFFHSKLILATSNLRDFSTVKSVQCVEAIERRWDVRVTVCPKPEFCTGATTSKSNPWDRRLDKSKIPTDVGFSEEIYEFHSFEFSEHGANHTWVPKYDGKVYSYTQLIEHIKKRYDMRVNEFQNYASCLRERRERLSNNPPVAQEPDMTYRVSDDINGLVEMAHQMPQVADFEENGVPRLRLVTLQNELIARNIPYSAVEFVSLVSPFIDMNWVETTGDYVEIALNELPFLNSPDSFPHPYLYYGTNRFSAAITTHSRTLQAYLDKMREVKTLMYSQYPEMKYLIQGVTTIAKYVSIFTMVYGVYHMAGGTFMCPANTRKFNEGQDETLAHEEASEQEPDDEFVAYGRWFKMPGYDGFELCAEKVDISDADNPTLSGSVRGPNVSAELEGNAAFHGDVHRAFLRTSPDYYKLKDNPLYGAESGSKSDQWFTMPGYEGVKMRVRAVDISDKEKCRAEGWFKGPKVKENLQEPGAFERWKQFVRGGPNRVKSEVGPEGDHCLGEGWFRPHNSPFHTMTDKEWEERHNKPRKYCTVSEAIGRMLLSSGFDNANRIERNRRPGDTWKDALLYPFEAEGGFDSALDSIMYKIMNNNQYLLFINGVKVGLITFIKDRFAIMPWHFVSTLLDARDVKDFVITTTNGRVSYKLDISVIRSGKRVESLDLALVEFPQKLRCHANIMKFFQPTGNSLNKDRDFNVRVTTMTENNELKLFHSPARWMGETTIKTKNGYVCAADCISYQATTRHGDCGSLIALEDPSTNLHKLVGIHIAGISDGRAIGTFLNQELFKELINEANSVDFQVDIGTECPDAQMSGPFVTVAKLDKPISLPSKSKIKPGLLYGQLVEIKTAPALLRSKKIGSEVIDPMAKGLSRYDGPVIDFSHAPLALARQSLYSHLVKNSHVSVEGTVYDFDTAVIGIPGIKFCDAIPRNTSAGYPFNVEIPPQHPGKTWFFGKGDEYNLTNEHCEQLRTRVNEIISNAKKNTRLLHIFADYLKDERRPLAKVEKGSTRLIFASPVDYLIATRMYFMAFGRWIMLNRIANGVAVGTNPYTEWDFLAKTLLSNSEQFIAGDFSGFDGSQVSDILWEIYYLIESWYDANGGTQEDKRVRYILWLDVVNSFHVSGSTLYEWTRSLPSGHPLTTIINSLYNHMLFRLAYFQYVEFDVKKFLQFDNFVRLVTYGDDMVGSVRKEASGFNQNTIPKFIHVFGATWTHESKAEGEYEDFRSITELDFLKRKFRFDEDLCLWMAPLSLDSVLEPCCWTKDNNRELLIQKSNIDMAFRELPLHGKIVFEEWRDKLLSLSQKHLQYVPMLTEYKEALELTLSSEYTY